METKKTGRGGARKGAGRPKGDSKLYSFRVDGSIARHLDRLENKTEFIKKSLKKAIADEENAPKASGDAIPASKVASLHLPFFDVRMVAGFPVPLDNDEKSQDIDVLRMLCPHPEASYLIRVKGDSMKDAGLESGDIVIVDKSNREPSPKDIAVCEYNGEYTLKHFVKEGNEGWLVPANPDYPKFHITSSDQFRVWGTVTYIIHKARS